MESRIQLIVDVTHTKGKAPRTVTIAVEEYELMNSLIETYAKWGEGEATTKTLDEVEHRLFMVRASLER